MAQPDATEVKTEIERGLRAYRAFEHADKVLAYMANLEQQERELLAKIAALHAEVATVEADAAQRIANAGQRAIDAETTALTIGSTAKADAEKILADATARATQLVSDAKRKAAEYASLLDQARTEMQGLHAQREERNKELNALTQSIAAAQGQIRALLGATR